MTFTVSDQPRCFVEGSPQVSVSVALFSPPDSFSSEKHSVSLLGGVVGGYMSHHLFSRSQAGERAGHGHSVPLHMTYRKPMFCLPWGRVSRLREVGEGYDCFCYWHLLTLHPYLLKSLLLPLSKPF